MICDSGMTRRIDYPRICENCHQSYSTRQTFSKHKTKGRCQRRIQAGKNVNDSPTTVINNNILNIHQYNQFIFPDAKDIDEQLFRELSLAERKCVTDALDILKHSGIVGFQQTKQYIDDNLITVDQFEQKIASCPISVLKVALRRMVATGEKQIQETEEKRSKLTKKQQELIDFETTNKQFQERIESVVESVFEKLLEGDDEAVAYNAKSLTSIPLHITQEGELKGWTSTEVTRCWLKMQPNRVWNRIIKAIQTRFFDVMKSDEEMSQVCSRSIHWYENYEEGMTQHHGLIEKLRKNIEQKSRQPPHRGFYSLSEQCSKINQAVITPRV